MINEDLPVEKLQSAINERKSRSAYASRELDTEWQPLGDRILVHKDPDPEMKGAIYLPETARKHTKEFCARGVVLKAGPGRRIEGTGERQPMSVGPGDEIVFGRWTDWESGGERVVLIQEMDILYVAKFAPREQADGKTHRSRTKENSRARVRASGQALSD